MNFKLITLSASVAFVLSFFTALISGAGMGIALLRAVILAVIFGLLSVGIHFLYEKFLNDGSEGSSSDGSQDAVLAPIGNKVDITIDDADLQEEDDTPKFVLTGQNQMLNKDDLSKKTYDVDNISSPVPAQKPVPADETDSPRYSVPVSNAADTSSKPAQTAPSFKPVSLGTPAEDDSDELPSIENTLGDGSFLKQGGDQEINEDSVDVLPEMGGTKQDDTVTDSEFAANGKKSRLSDPMFPDGSMAESKDSSLMAEAIRTILKSGE